MINEELGEGILDATKAIALASEKLMLVCNPSSIHVIDLSVTKIV